MGELNVVMVRKQLYLEPDQEQKLQRLAADWGCTEAQVIRTALDRVPDPRGSVRDRLRAAGILAPKPGPAPTREEISRVEAELERMFADRKEPLGLAEAVIEDRR